MHELSIAVEIVSIAEKSAKAEGCKKIKAIELEIGTVSGIETEALRTAMDFAIKDTMMETATISIVEIPGKASCLDCKHEFDIDLPFLPCPACSSTNTKIIQGKEMKVKSIKAE
jgi:hydrogenase nickel incorporation protein HypA/HybF